MKHCYVLMPFAAAFDAVYKVIADVAQDHEYHCRRADTSHDIGLVTSSVVLDLLVSDLVVADVTGMNPNVLYELGCAHAYRKPTILMSQDLPAGKALPFDISQMQTIPYALTRSASANGLAELREKLGHYFGSRRALGDPVSAALDSGGIKIFRWEFPWLVGYEQTFRAEAAAEEVWVASHFLFWEQWSGRYGDMIREKTLAGRKTSIMLPDLKELRWSARRYLDDLERAHGGPLPAIRILHVDEDFLRLLPSEIAIFSPYSSHARAILIEPMAPVVGADPVDRAVEDNIRDGIPNTLTNLKETTFDIELAPEVTRRLIGGFERLWERAVKEQALGPEWRL